ncbi:hypothetical protein V6N13_085934 [Hibiscus sabdariffa]|uniref:Uncharacterized protein n=1 Tax=Hibiscus sabdariffa TaxID=183260 RepID=A0ABR2FS55_9ROSI
MHVRGGGHARATTCRFKGLFLTKDRLGGMGVMAGPKSKPRSEPGSVVWVPPPTLSGRCGGCSVPDSDSDSEPNPQDICNYQYHPSTCTSNLLSPDLITVE